jgi:hypothetical protein
MSILSNAYASYMTHFHKFQSRLDTLNTAFSSVYDLIHAGQFIECNLDEKIDDYPKYPTIYRFFDKTYDFNVWKIYNVAPDTVEVLTDYITNKNALVLRPRLNSIPDDLIKLKNDIYFQYTFWADIDDLFNTKLHFHDYSMMKNIVNYYNSLFERPYNLGFSENSSSFIHIFLFDFLFRQQLKNMTNFPMALNMYCIDNDSFNKTQIKQGFNSFIDDNKTEFFSLCAKIILQSLYRMAKIDPSVTSIISKSIVDNNVERLKNSFGTYLDEYVSRPVLQLTQYSLNSFYLDNNENIFNLGFIQSNALNEDNIFRNFMSGVSTTGLKSYLYLTYLYKFWPIKFLNINPIVISKYVEELVKPDSNLAFSHKSLESLLSFSLSNANLNYSNLRDYFESNTTSSYLSDLANNENVVKFSFFIYFIKLFDDFMDHELYNNFVQDLYEEVFLILRDKGHVDNLFNWNNCQILFDLFFKSFIRLKITNNEIFNDLQSEYNQIFNNVLTSSTGESKYDVSFIFGEDRIRSLYGNLINSHFDKIHYFIESIYLSSLSATIGNQMLSYFLK